MWRRLTREPTGEHVDPLTLDQVPNCDWGSITGVGWYHEGVRAIAASGKYFAVINARSNEGRMETMTMTTVIMIRRLMWRIGGCEKERCDSVGV